METHEKVWGHEDWIVNNELYCFKKLHLKKGYRCSMHHHKIKDETFIVHSGKVLLEYQAKWGGKLKTSSRVMTTGDRMRIPPGLEHRFTGLEDSVIYEISTHHIEEDSYRSEPSGSVDV